MSTSYIGLYYPFIHFKDDNWLKVAALYWDRMARIVPKDYPTKHDSDTVKKLSNELKFIENIEPRDASADVGIRFTELLDKYCDELVKNYGLKNKDDWPDDPITVATAPEGSDPKLAYIYTEKLTDDLRNKLEGAKLAFPRRGDDNKWIGMHPKLVSVYMYALAQELAHQGGFHPLTDETWDHVAMAGWTLKHLAQGLLGDVELKSTEPIKEQEVEDQLLRIAFQTVIPKDINAIPVERIIEFRKQHFGELVNFQECVKGLVEEIQKLEIKDRRSLKIHLKIAYEKNVKLQQDTLKKALKSAKIRTTLTAMSVSTAPSSIVAVAITALGISVPIVTAGVIALGLTRVFLDYQKATAGEMEKNKTAYLQSIEKKLKPKHLMEGVITDTHKFFARLQN